MSQVVTVLFSARIEKEFKKVERDLLWYDSMLMKMKTFKGGYLEFEYGRDEELVEAGHPHPYRMMPKVAEWFEPINKKVTNEKEIIDWFNNYSNYNNSDVEVIGYVDSGIEFDVPDKELDDFLYECERRSFRTRR